MNMITVDRSVVQQGLEALVQIYQRAATAETQSLSDAVLLWSANADNTPESVRVEIQEVLWIRSSITALRAALAEPVEPVPQPGVWMHPWPPVRAQQAEPKKGGNLPPPLQAEPVQEPFGYLWPTGMHPEFRFAQQKRDGVDGMPLYTAPPQRKPLTDEEIVRIFETPELAGTHFHTPTIKAIAVARAIERAHGIGGQP